MAEEIDIDNTIVKLWSGYSNYAGPELERLLDEGQISINQRADILWNLIRHYHRNKKYNVALDYISRLEKIWIFRPVKIINAKVFCLCHLGMLSEANRVLDKKIRFGYFISVISSFITNKLVRFSKPLIFYNMVCASQNYYLLKSTVSGKLQENTGVSEVDMELNKLYWINRVFDLASLVRIKKENQSLPLTISNITSEGILNYISSPEKISIIMPMYNSEKTVAFAISSLLRQTWQNIEIIVVDDCSNDRSNQIVRNIQQEDNRIKLITMDKNSGTYLARNKGVKYCTGEYITINDADDWSHPEKLELQLKLLHKKKTSKAVMSYWTRIYDNLDIAGKPQITNSIIGLNFSSVLMRRSIIDEIGLWDEVKVGGDSEYLNRIKKYYGANSISEVPSNYILSLALRRNKSLTQNLNTHVTTLNYGARANYMNYYTYIHNLSNFRDMPGKPKFIATRFNQCGLAKDNDHYDFIIITDFALDEILLEPALDHLKLALRANKKIAIFHWRYYELKSDKSLNNKIYELCVENKIDILSPNENVTSKQIVIVYPEIFEYIPDSLPDISTEEVVIDRKLLPIHNYKKTGLKMDRSGIDSNIKNLFG